MSHYSSVDECKAASVGYLNARFRTPAILFLCTSFAAFVLAIVLIPVRHVSRALAKLRCFLRWFILVRGLRLVIGDDICQKVGIRMLYICSTILALRLFKMWLSACAFRCLLNHSPCVSSSHDVSMALLLAAALYPHYPLIRTTRVHLAANTVAFAGIAIAISDSRVFTRGGACVPLSLLVSMLALTGMPLVYWASFIVKVLQPGPSAVLMVRYKVARLSHDPRKASGCVLIDRLIDRVREGGEIQLWNRWADSPTVMSA